MLALLCGCMATKRFSPADQKKIHTISISKIENPKGAYYLPPSSTYLGVLAILANADMPKKIEDEALSNHIIVGNMAYDKFVSELSKKYKISNDGKNADANFEAKILHYGFSIPHGFSSNLVPVMSIHAKLVQGKKVLWENNYIVNTLDGLPQHRPDEIFTNPQIMRASLQDAVNEGVPGILAKMN